MVLERAPELGESQTKFSKDHRKGEFSCGISSMLPAMEGSLGLCNGPSTLAHSRMQRSMGSLRPRVQPDDLRSTCSTVYKPFNLADMDPNLQAPISRWSWTSKSDV